jgi:AcrR family transcriptional regulator
MSTSPRSYHHGNLKDALIVAAAELIDSHGTTEFSITDAANRAGVSNAAPYRHYKDKQDLLEHVRELAFLGLYEALDKASRENSERPGPADQIIAIGLAYLAYARDKERFFSLMWEQAPPNTDQETKMSGFYVLADAVSTYLSKNLPEAVPEYKKKGDQPEQEVLYEVSSLRIATQLWALAHGLATLEQHNLLARFDTAAKGADLLTRSSVALLQAALREGSQAP